MNNTNKITSKNNVMLFCSWLLVLTFASHTIVAQQQTAWSSYDQLSGLFNPAAIPDNYTKYQHNINIGVSARRQWTKFNSAPKTQSIAAEYITDADNTFNFLFGGYLLNDRAGPVSSTGLYAKIASIMSRYDPTIGGFSGGIQLGMMQYRINTDVLREKYPDDILTLINVSTIKPAVSIGVSYYNKIKTKGFFRGTYFNTGLSIAQLGFSKTEFADELKKFNIFTEPHLYFYAKLYKPFRLQNALEFNTWVKYVPDAPVNMDLHLLYFVNKQIWLEAGANSSGIGHVGLGFQLQNFYKRSENLLRINYAYNPSFFKYGSVLGNTHEIGLKYSFRKE